MAYLSYRIVDFNFTKITTIVNICIRSQQNFVHLSSITVYPFHSCHLVILGTLGCTEIFTLCYKRIRFAHCYVTLLTT